MRKIRGFVVVVLSALLFSPVSALAYTPDAGDEPGPGMTVLETVGFFVLLPLAIWGVIWVLWSIPKWRRDAGPRSGEDWNPIPSKDVVSK